MLGAVIGDLAAWTYENDRGTYYTDLVSPQAELSVFGQAALDAAVAIASGNLEAYSPAELHSDNELLHAPRLLQSIQTGWAYDEFFKCREAAERIRMDAAEKEGMYFIGIALEAILKLRKGGTKMDLNTKEFFSFDGAFSFAYVKWPASKNILAYLAWAKEALDESWDFTSAIYQACFKPGDRHFLFAVTGALAEAMYGCEMRLLKSEYTHETYKPIQFPGDLISDMGMIRGYDMANRHFFPKNCAMTNTDRFKWIPYASKFEGRVVSSSFADCIRKAFYTDWDNRYGIYFENGWHYVYRSGRLEARFRLVENGFDTSRIVNVQYPSGPTGLLAGADIPIEEALNSVYKLLDMETNV